MLKEPPLYLIRVKNLDREQRLIESFQILGRNRCVSSSFTSRAYPRLAKLVNAEFTLKK